jgi:spore germination protein GerM
MMTGVRARAGRWTARWRGATVVAATGALVLAACGLPNDGTYTAIRPDDLPAGLADTTTTSTTTTTLPPATTTTAPEATTTTTTIPTQAVSVFYVVNGRLQPVVRHLPLPVSIQTVADNLDTGPLPQEQAAGVRSALPPNSLGTVTATGGVATVDLAQSVVTPTPSTEQLPVPNVDQPLAFGQIVLTLTSLPGIGQVRFTVGSQPQGALAADGSLIDGPVSADNYASLRAA